jgi:PAS domain S-box-containing protein
VTTPSSDSELDAPATDSGWTANVDGERLIDGAGAHAIFRLDPSGYIATWPRPAAELYGYDVETVVGEHVRVLLADRDAGGTGPDAETFLENATTATREVEHWHERADGSVFWGSMTLSPLSDGGSFDGYVAVCEDDTEKKEYERMLERQNDRLKEFTDILAHDLRNPLNVVEGNLHQYLETGEEEHLRTVEDTTARMGRLVEDLLRVARQGVVVDDPQPVDLEPVVVMAWEGTGGLAQATLEYESVRRVSGDADRLCELFENVFRNATEHAGEDVRVRVGPLANGFFVEDDGPGIPPDRRERVFEHGFTTREDGSGYGLSIVRTIVNAHGWDVRVTEGTDGGARFEITGIEFIEESDGSTAWPDSAGTAAAYSGRSISSTTSPRSLSYSSSEPTVHVIESIRRFLSRATAWAGPSRASVTWGS